MKTAFCRMQWSDPSYHSRHRDPFESTATFFADSDGKIHKSK